MKIFTTICCAALTICGAVYAQSNSDHMTVHFNAPVMVGETRIPAGNCDIQVVRGNSDNVILVLRAQGGATAAAMVSRVQETDTEAEGGSSVVLNRRGNDLQLYRVMMTDHTGYQLFSAVE